MAREKDKAKRLMWALLIAYFLASLLYLDFAYWKAKQSRALQQQKAATDLLVKNLRESMAGLRKSMSDSSTRIQAGSRPYFDSAQFERIPLEELEQPQGGCVIRQIELYFSDENDAQ